MYNDKKSSFPSDVRRDLPPRVPIGRSCPTFAQNGGQSDVVPLPEERVVRRLCDGSLADEMQSTPNSGRMGERNMGDASRRNCQNDNVSRGNRRSDEGLDGGCGDGVGGFGLHSYPLAMVYSPLQEFRELYDVDVALGRGTIFAELDLPFEGGMSGKGGCKLC